MLKKKFDKDSVLIKNHFPLIGRGILEKAKPAIVLWVGTMADTKQPELFPKLAEAIPEASFQMIGGPSTDLGPYKRAKECSKRILNLKFLGFIQSIDEYFSRAAILVNTAKSEGFPYAFIQAWMNYTPVISLHSDPDGIIYKYNMGFHSKTFDQLVEDVKTLLNNEALREEMGVNGREYVEREHDITKIISKHIEVFRQVLRG
jgi:glycosyltransferase involved in cell wall biosynthesis